jgi:hypothetical protein
MVADFDDHHRHLVGDRVVPFDCDPVQSVRTHARDIFEVVLQQEFEHPGELGDGPGPRNFVINLFANTLAVAFRHSTWM